MHPFTDAFCFSLGQMIAVWHGFDLVVQIITSSTFEINAMNRLKLLWDLCFFSSSPNQKLNLADQKEI